MIIRRVFAFLIDAIIANLFALIPIVGWLIGFLYMLLRDGLTDNGSLGKKLLNLQVTTLQGAQVTYAESIRRNIIFAIPTVFSIIPFVGWFISIGLALIIYILEIVTMAGDPQGQRYGDRWAETIVREASTYFELK